MYIIYIYFENCYTFYDSLINSEEFLFEIEIGNMFLL